MEKDEDKKIGDINDVKSMVVKKEDDGNLYINFKNVSVHVMKNIGSIGKVVGFEEEYLTWTIKLRNKFRNNKLSDVKSDIKKFFGGKTNFGILLSDSEDGFGHFVSEFLNKIYKIETRPCIYSRRSKVYPWVKEQKEIEHLKNITFYEILAMKPVMNINEKNIYSCVALIPK